MLKLKSLSSRKKFFYSALIALVIIGGLVSVRLIWHDEPAQNSTAQSLMTPDDYRAEARAAVQDYETAVRTESGIDIEARRTHLLAMLVTKDNRDLHFRLVQIADALQSKNGTAENLLSQLYASYPWLKS